MISAQRGKHEGMKRKKRGNERAQEGGREGGRAADARGRGAGRFSVMVNKDGRTAVTQFLPSSFVALYRFFMIKTSTIKSATVIRSINQCCTR